MDFVSLEGGSFLMGTDEVWFEGDGEGPVREVVLSPYRIAATAVTNDDFAAFAAATGHVTTAEREGWSFVFAGLLPDDFPPTRGVVGAEWWRQVEGACWRNPEGPQSELEGRGRHPVVHVSWFDAVACADWYGARLPTEAEWEHAARGGLVQALLPWGDDMGAAAPGPAEPGAAAPATTARPRLNIWEGDFPSHNTAADGYVGTAPVDEYEPNGFGLYNCSGNVWEWCADWFDNRFPPQRPLVDPTGPAQGRSRVIRGGSYLCHDSYCNRYRVAARHANEPASTTAHMGFRLAADAEATPAAPGPASPAPTPAAPGTPPPATGPLDAPEQAASVKSAP